jgi:hypothetical protein
MVRAEDGRPGPGHPAERLAGLVPVAELLRHHAQVERDLQHQRVGVTEPPLPGGVRLLEDPARGGRVVGLLVHPSELMQGRQDVRIILTERALPGVDGMLEHRARTSKITGPGQGLRALADGKKRGRLRHPAMLHGTCRSRQAGQTLCPRLFRPMARAARLQPARTAV